MSDSDALLQRLVDESDITRVIRQFSQGVDRADAALIKSCFHEDGTDDHGPHFGVLPGHEFADLVVERLKSQSATGHHFVGVPLIEINRPTAVAESYFHNLHRIDDAIGIRHEWAGGRYVDQLELRDGRWAFTARKVIIEWDQQTAGPSWLEREYYGEAKPFPHDLIHQLTQAKLSI